MKLELGASVEKAREAGGHLKDWLTFVTSSLSNEIKIMVVGERKVLKKNRTPKERRLVNSTRVRKATAVPSPSVGHNSNLLAELSRAIDRFGAAQKVLLQDEIVKASTEAETAKAAIKTIMAELNLDEGYGLYHKVTRKIQPGKRLSNKLVEKLLGKEKLESCKVSSPSVFIICTERENH